jgi:serpin B
MGLLGWLTGQRAETPRAAVEEPRTDEAAVVLGTRAFALAVYGELSNGGGGFFCSPSSIVAVLALVAAGAGGETAAELLQALRIPLPAERLHPALAALLSQRRVPAAVPPPPPLIPGLDFLPPQDDVETDSSLWMQTGHPLLPKYLALVRETYDAALEEVDFERAAEEARAKINAHVAAATHGRLREIVPCGSVGALTRLVLVNTVYFKRPWLSPFPLGATRDEPFFRLRGGSVDAPLMHQTDRFRLVEESDLAAIELFYQRSSLSMVVVLPKRRAGLSAVERRLDSGGLGALLARLDGAQARQVVLTLPRFRMVSTFSLGDALKALGVQRAFARDRADLSGMTSNPNGVYVSAVLHQAFVEVNEEGTEASAATATLKVTIGEAEPEPPPAVFRADHPFLFLIRNERRLIWFVGRVLDPTC